MDQLGDVRLSFVIPVRDDAARLERCLRSIARARVPGSRIEVVVVDNESSDRSGDVARAHGAVVLVAGGRVAALRNLGAERANGELLAFVDADHEIAVGWICAALEIFASPAIGAAGAPYLAAPRANWIQRQYDAFRSRAAAQTDAEWLGSGNLVVRRDAFVRVAGFDATLDTCEDVDLCNRLCRAGFRLVSDPRLASVHFGDPASLRSLFFGELWRGRDNLRVTLRGPITLPRLRSLLIPVADLCCLAGAAVAIAAGVWIVAAAALAIVAALAAVRATVMLGRQPSAGIAETVQALAVAAVYDVARALSLAAGGSHRIRRSSEQRAHVPTDSRP